MNTYRNILFSISAVSIAFAVYLSVQVDQVGISTEGSYALDSAKDGGAAGFAILAGLSLIAASITYLKKSDS